MKKMKKIKILFLTFVLFAMASCGSATDLVSLSAATVTNADRTLESFELQRGEEFLDMTLQHVWSVGEAPRQAHFDGEIVVRGTLRNTSNIIWDPIFVVDEAYLGYLPMFDIERREPYSLYIIDFMSALSRGGSAFTNIRLDLMYDFTIETAERLSGSRATFKIESLFISEDPNYNCAVFGYFLQLTVR